jgi:hypothetical protein
MIKTIQELNYAISNQPETKQEEKPKKRKPIFVSSIAFLVDKNNPLSRDGIVREIILRDTVICDDGSMWRSRSDITSRVWTRVIDIPQDEE